MERKLCRGPQTIIFDREATIDLYSRIVKVLGADSCRCIFCKNFAAQRQTLFPIEFSQFLEELGIDPTREWEAFEYNFAKNPNKLLFYGGWFVFVGAVVEGADHRPDPEQKDFVHWFTSSFPAGTLPTGIVLCAVEFLIQIPWVLPEIPSTNSPTEAEP